MLNKKNIWLFESCLCWKDVQLFSFALDVHVSGIIHKKKKIPSSKQEFKILSAFENIVAVIF